LSALKEQLQNLYLYHIRMSERTLHFTARGFRPQLVDIAPEAMDPRSKRTDIIKKEDQNLDRNLDELEEGTKARNRAFQRRLVSFQFTNFDQRYYFDPLFC
jgi:hypothetical protein